MATPKAIFFDIDGTLVDSNDFHVEAWSEAFREAGHAIPRGRIHDQIGKGSDNLVPALLPDADEEAKERFAKRHGEIFKSRYLDRVQPFAGARDLLARAHAAGVKVILASSASAEELDHYVDLLDAGDLVDAGTSKDDVETTKPAPDIFAVALEKSGADRHEVIVVGDTPYDAEAAAKLGIRTIGLLSGGFSEASLRAAGADPIMADAAALLESYDSSPLGA